MNQDYNLGVDTIVLGNSTDDTITIDDIFNFDDDNNTITLTDWDSPLQTSLTNSYAFPSATLGTVGASATTGATLSTTLNNGLMWNNTSTASPYINSAGNWTTYQQPQVLRVSGDAEFEGEIKVRGVSLTERLDAIEERLGILRPNNDLEGKWEKLKKLGDEYRKLEQEILAGENIWDMLKK